MEATVSYMLMLQSKTIQSKKLWNKRLCTVFRCFNVDFNRINTNDILDIINIGWKEHDI